MPGLHAFFLAPRTHDVPATTRTTTVRVIDGVHDLAANLGTAPHPARLSSLTPRQQLVLGVADRADRREALAMDHAHLGRAHAHRDVFTLFRHHFYRSARATSDLATLPLFELDVVHVGTQRDLAQRKRIPDAHIRARAGHDRVADLETAGVQDVALLAVRVLDEGDTRRAIRIVLDLAHRGGDAVLVALEVDDPVLLLVPATEATHRDVPVIVAAAGLLERLDQRLLGIIARDLGEIRDRAEARALRDWLELANGHGPLTPLTLEDIDRITLTQGDDRLLPIVAPASRTADATDLSALIRGPDARDLHAEERLDSLTDRRLRRGRRDLERVFAALLIRRGTLLRDERADDDAMQDGHRLFPLLFAGALLRRLFGDGLLRGGLVRLGFRLRRGFLLRYRLLGGGFLFGGRLRRSTLSFRAALLR